MSTLLDQLHGIVGREGLLVGADVSARSESWSSTAPCRALAIVRPRTTDELASTLRLCNQSGQPLVPYGGGTGLVAGTAAQNDELILSLERFRTIEAIDPDNRTATVQAGVTLQQVQQAAQELDLFFPLDLGARGTATVGGAISTNAGGNRVLRYGMMREQVLGLEAVLIDGTVLSSMNQLIKNNAGYDLRQLFVGSEGTLGVVTRAVLRLREAPQSQNVALVAVGDKPDALIQLLKSADRGLGGTLSAFEVMWPEFYNCVTQPAGRYEAPLPHGAPFYCLIESLGGAPREDRMRFETVLGGLLEDGIIIDAVIAESQAQATGIWALRDDVERLWSLGPIFLFDVGMPIHQIHDYVASIKQSLRSQWPLAQCIVWGHVGDGNLHVCVAVGDGSNDARTRVESCVYEPLRAIGGTISAEHGIGLEKLDYLEVSRSRSEIDAMRKLKRAFDPRELLNRRKVFSLSAP